MADTTTTNTTKGVGYRCLVGYYATRCQIEAGILRPLMAIVDHRKVKRGKKLRGTSSR